MQVKELQEDTKLVLRGKEKKKGLQNLYHFVCSGDGEKGHR